VPADRTLAADVAQALVDMYAAAQQEVAENIARRLRAGIDQPGWEHQKLIAVGELRQSITRLLHKLATDTTGEVEQTMVLAFARGGQAALDELAKMTGLSATQLAEFKRSATNADAANRLAFALRSTLLGTHVRILRWSLDAYREVVGKAAAAGPGLLGTKTRLQVAQDAWSKLVAQGVTGFVDKAGRNWRLSSYVEMATRTTIAHAVVQAHSDQLDDLGVPLRIVSNAPQECVKCRPWEGKILTAHGGKRQILRRIPSMVSDEPMVVRVAGSVDQAIAAGLLHPNCRHTINAYLPGVTTVPTNTADPEGDKARQELRALERQVRAGKMQEAAALSDEGRAAARAKVRRLQSDIRDHVAANPGLFRQTHREQIGAGNIPLSARNSRRPPRAAPEPKPDKAPDELHSAGDSSTPEVQRAPDTITVAPAVDHSKLTDDELDTAFNDAVESGDDSAVESVLAEMDRRQSQKDAAAAEQAEQDRLDADRQAFIAEQADDEELDDEQAEQWQRFDELLAAGGSEESAAAEVFGRDIEQQRRDRAITQLRGQGYSGKGFADLARKAYKDHVYQQYIAAEDATRGHMVTPAGQAAGIDPHELFSGPAARARKWASDELKEWWDEHGRLTYDDYVALLLGDNPTSGGTTGDSWLR
jgi:hypothetical protein